MEVATPLEEVSTQDLEEQLAKSQKKSRKSQLIKIAVIVLVFVFLAKKGLVSVEATKKAFTRLDLLGPAFVGLISLNFLAIIRWHLLLRAQQLIIPFSETIKLVFIGNFFNLALPGAVSGDFVKAYLIGKAVQGRRGLAFGSILFDRVTGLSALIFVSAGALALRFNEFVHSSWFLAIRVSITTFAVGVFVFYSYLFLVREKHDPVLILLKVLQRKWPIFIGVTNTYLGLRYYHNHKLTVIVALAISIVTHLCVCWAMSVFVLALGDDTLNFVSIAVIAPLGMLVTAIPVLPAGVGTGHAAYSWLFHLLGSERGADVFNLFIFTQLITGAIGGAVYLAYRNRDKVKK